jgi:hypothetical protein
MVFGLVIFGFSGIGLVRFWFGAFIKNIFHYIITIEALNSR